MVFNSTPLPSPDKNVVHFRTFADKHKSIRITVTGAVRYPGVHTFMEGATFRSLIQRVQPKRNAFMSFVNYNMQLLDGDQIHIPESLSSAGHRVKLDRNNLQIVTIHRAPVKTGSKKAADNRVDINNASLEQLVKLPGIGPEISIRIIEDIARNGHYEKIDDLRRVNGIGKGTVKRIKDHVIINP